MLEMKVIYGFELARHRKIGMLPITLRWPTIVHWFADDKGPAHQWMLPIASQWPTDALKYFNTFELAHPFFKAVLPMTQ